MNPEKIVKLADVYGVSRQVPLTYVERPNVDGRFLNSLARDKHLVVYAERIKRNCEMVELIEKLQAAASTAPKGGEGV